jgi:hypothetical protein
VTNETAAVLMTSGHNCYVRGDIFVKGKGIITTYFVKTPFDNGNHQPSPSSEGKVVPSEVVLLKAETASTEMTTTETATAETATTETATTEIATTETATTEVSTTGISTTTETTATPEMTTAETTTAEKTAADLTTIDMTAKPIEQPQQNGVAE